MNTFLKKFQLLKKKNGEGSEPELMTSPGQRHNVASQLPSGSQDPMNQRTTRLLPLLVKPPQPSAPAEKKKAQPQPLVLPELAQRKPSKQGPLLPGETSREQTTFPKLPVAKAKRSGSPLPKKKTVDSGAPTFPELSDEHFRYLWDPRKLQKARTVKEAVQMMDEREVLDTILAHLQQPVPRPPATEPKQTGKKTAAGTDTRAATSHKAAAQQRSPKSPVHDKTPLYKYYGVKLRDTTKTELVSEYLYLLLRLSAQEEDREGISEAIGLVAYCHLSETVAVLTDYGHLMTSRKSLQAELMPEEQRSVMERQMRMTLLLCFGYAAVGAKQDDILPMAETIVSEILYHFRKATKDDALKKVFLRATVMVTKALENCKKEDVRIPYKTELVICIIGVIEEEPLGSFSIAILQQALLTVSCLTALKPTLDPDIRSELVSQSIKKVFSLPSLKMTKLKACSPMHPTQTQDFYQQTINTCNSMLINLLTEAPNILALQDILLHTNYWIESQKSYERERAVRSTTYLLKFVSEHLDFDISQEFSLLGQLVALLALRIADNIKDIGVQASEAIYYLHYITMSKLNREMEKRHKNKKGNIVRWFREDFLISGPSVFYNNISKVAKAFGEHLSSTQMSEVVLKAIENISSEDRTISQGAGVLLSSFLEECGTDMEDLPMIVKEIYNHLSDISDPATKDETLRAVCCLASKRVNGVVDSLLECSLECDSSIAELWRALANDPYSNTRLLRPLLKRLQDEDPVSEVCNRRHSKSIMPMAATNALCLILSCPDYGDIIQPKFTQMLIALVTQIYFVIGSGRRDSRRFSNVDAPFPYTPLSSAIQALKHLILCAGYVKEFNILGMQGCWDMLAVADNYFDGVFHLIRTLFTFNKMHLKMTFKHANTYLRRPDVKERTIGMAFFTELLYHSEIGLLFVKQDILDVLREWMIQACPLMQVFSIRGLGYLLQHPFDDDILEPFLSPLVNYAFHSDKNIVKESIKTLRNMFRHLDPEDFDSVGVTLVPHLLRYLNEGDNEFRCASVALFGSLLKGIQENHKQSMKDDVFKSFVPLLIQLTDSWTREISKDALVTCVRFMNWTDIPKEVFDIESHGTIFMTYGNICRLIVRKNKMKLPEMVADTLPYVKDRIASHREIAAAMLGAFAQHMSPDVMTAKAIEDVYLALQNLHMDYEVTVSNAALEATRELFRYCGHRINPHLIPHHLMSILRAELDN